MFLSRVKKATSEFVKILLYGKSDVRTAQPIFPFGFDSKPVNDLVALYSNTGADGEPVVVGYIYLSDITDIGESRIYSTDSNGNSVFDIILKNDGTCEIGSDADNMVRYRPLASAYNQLKSDHDDTVSKLNAVINLLKTWTFLPGDGGAALKTAAIATLIDASNSTGDITGAKIDEVKTL